jgi:hypothetical protein
VTRKRSKRSPRKPGAQTTPLRSVGVFTLTFLVLIPATLWCYTKVLPSYQATVAAGANGVLSLVGSTRTISPHEEGGWTSDAAPRRRLVTGPPDYGSQQLESLFLSLAILPALILATPLPWGRRLALLGIGTATLWAVHVAAVIALVQTESCNHDSAVCHLIRSNVYIGGQLFALALWALLTWEFWLQRQAELSERRAQHT